MSSFLSRRRGLGLIMVAALALLISRAFSGRPEGVDVVYRFGSGAAQIRTLEARYHAGHQAEVANSEGALLWRFGAAGAPAEQVHATRLTAGEHTVELSVTDAAGAKRTGEARVDVGGWTRSRVIIDVP